MAVSTMASQVGKAEPWWSWFASSKTEKSFFSNPEIMVNYCVNLLGVAVKKGHPNEKFGDFMRGSLGFFFSFVS